MGRKRLEILAVGPAIDEHIQDRISFGSASDVEELCADEELWIVPPEIAD